MDVYMKFALILLFLSIHGWAKWSVSTYNIRNFDNDPGAGRTNLPELGRIIKDVQSDVMAFVEVVNKSAFETLIQTNLPGYAYQISNCGGFGKQHLAIVYNKKSFDYVRHTEDLTFSGPDANKCGSLRPVFLVTLKNKASGKNMTFGAIHLKAGGNIQAMERRWQQYIKLQSLSSSLENENLILLGDFNTTGYSPKDQDYEKFETLLSQSNLRTTSETIQCSSYWAGLNGGSKHLPSTLDHIVLRDSQFAQVESVRVGSHCAQLDCREATPADLGLSYQSVSDHCPIQVTFK
jgi:endonuclease/exonuclease/phosphatase family metal-dependent hydrolase